MACVEEILRLCRLCLQKQDVKTPIFEQEGDIKEIFLKITTCLPVKVSREDQLPKKICDDCTGKLDSFYNFWKTTVDSEKQLLNWLSHIDKTPAPLTGVKTTEKLELKQEIVDPPEIRSEEDVSSDAVNDSGYPQTHSEKKRDTLQTNDPSVSEEPPPKRARRSVTLKKQIQTSESDEDDDFDGGADPKVEEGDTDNSDDADDPGFGDEKNDDEDHANIDDQPGPSGVGKSTGDQSLSSNHLEPLVTITEQNWMQKLPEIDVTVIKKEIIEDEPAEDSIDSDEKNDPSWGVKKTVRTPKRGPNRKVVPIYKNPFVYSNLKAKAKKPKKMQDIKNNKWTCMICSEVKDNKESLIEHYEFHKTETEESIGLQGLNSGGDYFMCPVCLSDFTSLRSYEKHVEQQHGERQFCCQECNKLFKNGYQLCIHNFKVHSTSNKYECPFCKFSTIDLKTAKNHLKEKHEEDIKFRCEICNKGFTTASWYEEHKNFHTGAMPFECEVCFKSFPYTRYLVAHKRSMHPEIYSETPITHECEICHKRFAHKKSLVLHVRGHTGENSVLCDMCGKCLSSPEHLKQHIRIHTGYKPYACTYCGKAFAKKCNLTLHERVHSGEKPYICNFCGKGFSQRSTLVIHTRYHTGEKPYVCQLCTKGFVAKGLLGVHLKTCSGLA